MAWECKEAVDQVAAILYSDNGILHRPLGIAVYDLLLSEFMRKLPDL